MNAMKTDYVQQIFMYLPIRFTTKFLDYDYGVRWVSMPSFTELFTFTYHAVIKAFPLPPIRYMNF